MSDGRSPEASRLSSDRIALPPLVVGIGGTIGAVSSSERALRAALACAERYGAQTKLLCGIDLNLPIYSPYSAERTPAAKALVSLLRSCDGLIVATPAYHGGISGLVKNALDYVEDLRSDARCYLDERAVGCIVSAAGWQAVGCTLTAMRNVVHALRGWPTPSAAGFNTLEPGFGADTAFDTANPDPQLDRIARQVVDFAHMQRIRGAFQSNKEFSSAECFRRQ